MNLRSYLALSSVAWAAAQAIACGGSSATGLGTSDAGADHTAGSGSSSSGSGGSSGSTGSSGGTSSSSGSSGTSSSSGSIGDPCAGVPCGTVCGTTPQGNLYCDSLGKCGMDPPSRACNTGTPDAAMPPIDAGTCTSLRGQACADCCNMLWPVADPELVFSNECYSCMGVCDGFTVRQHPPCGANTSSQPDACFACAKGKIPPPGPIGGCTAPPCSAFVQCFSQCTAN